MSLSIYLDDCANSKTLAALLKEAGHAVTNPAHADLRGADDLTHFIYTRDNGLLLLTKNPHDFVEILQAELHHPGILAVYQDNDSSRDMSYADIVGAIGNIENAGIQLQDQVHILNGWRY